MAAGPGRKPIPPRAAASGIRARPAAAAASLPVLRPATRSAPSTMTGAVPMVTRVASGTEVSETAVK